MTLVFGSIALLDVQALNPLFAIPARIVAASFIAFRPVQPLFMYFLKECSEFHPLPAIPAITTAMRALDGAAFLPCAFSATIPGGRPLGLVIVG